jgi:protein-disulfide isomerase
LPKHMVKIRDITISSIIILLFSLVSLGTVSAEPKTKNSKSNSFAIESIIADRVLGSANAKITVIEYASMTCRHCAKFHAGPFQILKTEYIETGEVRFIYRDFPLDQLALAAAMMARCAPKERYYPIVDIIFRTQKNWAKQANPTDALSQIGLLSGISKKSYKACVGNKEIYEGVMKIRNDGERKFNIQSTPTIIINGKPIKGHLTAEKLRLTLDSVLAKSKPTKR